MISATIMQRLSALDMPSEAFREVLSIIAELKSADDTRREGQRLRTQKHRVTLQQRDGDVACNVTEPQERSPTPPKEIISNLLPFSKDQVRKQERSEIVALVDWPRDFREQFWAIYPKRVDKAGAMKKLDHVRRSAGVTFTALMAAVGRYAALKLELQFTKSPKVWLNNGCWDDEHAPAVSPIVNPLIQIHEGTEEMDAWDRHWRQTKGVNAPRSKHGGIFVPTQWPPGEPHARHDHADQSPRA